MTSVSLVSHARHMELKRMGPMEWRFGRDGFCSVSRGQRVGCILLSAFWAVIFLEGVSSARAGEEQTLVHHNFLAVSLTMGLVLFSAITALFHMTGRKQWMQRERELVNELEDVRAHLDRAQVFLSSEPQIVVAWSAANGDPEITGDISLVTDAPVPRRVLGFGSWLDSEAAQRLETNVERLRRRGQGFRMALQTSTGRHLEADGRAIAGRAVLRIRDVSGDRMELLSLKSLHADLAARKEAMRAMLEAISAPVWLRDRNDQLVYVNSAYVRAVEAQSEEEARRKSIELLDRAAREAARKKTIDGHVWRARLAALVNGERRQIDAVEAPSLYGVAGYAQDLSELESLRGDLERQMASHARTLDQLATAVAIFDGKKRLSFHNAAYRQLWGLPQAFLDAGPTDPEILDRLRAEKKLPEQADFRLWKSGLMASYQISEISDQIWYLPDGRTLRVVSHPGPQGGLTYLFDDVSERFNLESQVNAIARVQSETLDTLQEGVVVFGTDGRLKLSNPAFAAMWGFNETAISQRPHFEAIAKICAPLCVNGEEWRKLQGVVTGLHEQRVRSSVRLDRCDGGILDCAALPLPDGATLLTFIDVTAQAEVERALTERNRALMEAENLRDDFVHHISYELRSPLTNIIGFISLLDDKKSGQLTAKQQDYVKFAMQSSHALLAIINDILDLASIDKNAMELEVSEVDIVATMRAAVEGVQDRLQDRLTEIGVELALVAMDDIGSFEADGRRLRQVLFNLLSNAIGFSSPGQTVTLAALRRENEIVFKVTDRGRGIPPDVLDKVFDRFRSHTIGTRHRGVGLGLSIVRALVELHGGRVQIDSVLGEGTVVTCIFPARAAATAPGAATHSPKGSAAPL